MGVIPCRTYESGSQDKLVTIEVDKKWCFSSFASKIPGNFSFSPLQDVQDEVV
jgi:hypothetical protein